MGHGVKQPIEHKRGRNKQRVPLRLHDGFLVAEVFGRGTRPGRFADGPGLVLPVDVQEEEEAERDDGKEGFEEVEGHGC